MTVQEQMARLVDSFPTQALFSLRVTHSLEIWLSYKSIRFSKQKSSTSHIAHTPGLNSPLNYCFTTTPLLLSSSPLFCSPETKMELKHFAKRVVVLFVIMQYTTVEAMREHRRFAGISNIQRLHEMLAIDTSDPREDIRTNILLNMEGF
jgi:heme/copper-type cytochrome/quinol oxidase subunit 2